MPELDTVAKAKRRRAPRATSSDPGTTVSLTDNLAGLTIPEIEEVGDGEAQTPPKFDDFAEQTRDGLKTIASTAKPGTGWSPDDTDALTLVVTMALMFGGIRLSFWASGTKDLAPTDEIAADFAAPLCRIFSRHFKLAGQVRGDFADIMYLSSSLLAYMIHVFNVRDAAQATARRRETEQLNAAYEGREVRDVSAINGDTVLRTQQVMKTIHSGMSMGRHDGKPTFTPGGSNNG